MALFGSLQAKNIDKWGPHFCYFTGFKSSWGGDSIFLKKIFFFFPQPYPLFYFHPHDKGKSDAGS